MSDPLPKLVETLAERWLYGTQLGRRVRAEMSTDDAIDAVFNLLNLGFLKLAVDQNRQPSGFTFHPIPCPPRRPINRAAMRLR